MFEVGDVCRIREWDDMAAEFGVDREAGCIHFFRHPIFFTKLMRYMCGKEFIISNSRLRSGVLCYRSEDNIENGYLITDEMLELVNDAEISPAELESLILDDRV